MLARRVDKPSGRIVQRWPCLAAIFALWTTGATFLLLSLRMNQGHLVCALDEASQAQLIENLRMFSPSLPADVEQLGPYTSR
jgi:hypothetical protein